MSNNVDVKQRAYVPLDTSSPGGYWVEEAEYNKAGKILTLCGNWEEMRAAIEKGNKFMVDDREEGVQNVSVYKSSFNKSEEALKMPMRSSAEELESKEKWRPHVFEEEDSEKYVSTTQAMQEHSKMKKKPEENEHSLYEPAITVYAHQFSTGSRVLPMSRASNLGGTSVFAKNTSFSMPIDHFHGDMTKE